MMTMRRAAAPALCLLALAAGLVACGGQPAVCDDVDALRTSVDHLKNIQIGDNALATLSTDLQDVQSQLKQLRQDASGQYSSQIDAVQKEVDALRSSVKTATTNPSSTSFTEVTSDVKSLGSALGGLDDAVSGTCQ